MGIIEKLKGVWRKMTSKEVVERVLSVKPTVSTDMVNAITLWSAMYEDKSPWLKTHPTAEDPVRVVSLGLASSIASEKARMATIEMESEITPPMKDVEKENPNYQPPQIDENGQVSMGRDSMLITEPEPAGPTERAEFLNTAYKKLKKQIRTQLEYGIAKGGLIIKPYVVMYDESKTPSFNNKKSEADNADNLTSSDDPLPKYEIEFDFVQADMFYPLSFDNNGKITEAAFLQQKVDNDKIYTRLEHHKLTGRSVTVRNYAFVRANGDGRPVIAPTRTEDLGKPCSLSEVAEWANFEEEVTIDNVNKPLFAYFKMPEANTIDTHSPLGVSGYARAVSLIKDADEQYSRLLWEYEGGEMAIDVDRYALKIEESTNTTRMPVKQERLFRKVDLNSEETYNVFAPPLRDTSIINGLNTILTRIEDTVGLSRGTFSVQTNTEAMTATELKILKQRSYSTNADIQAALEEALRDSVYVMDVYCSLYNITPAGKYEISFEWDDSILVDIDTELERRMSLVNAGISSKLETRMWFFGETENQAKTALQKVEDEKKQSIETNIMGQKELGEVGQGKDMTGDNNNPNAEIKSPTEPSSKNSKAK